MAYAVVRTDNLAGTTTGSLLRSAVSEKDMQNGSVVKLVKLKDGETEIYSAEEANGAKMGQFALVAAPEKQYDARQHNPDEFTNEKGTPFRCYVLSHGDTFAITAEGFSATPEVGNKVGLPASGYTWETSASVTTEVGTIISIESESGYTYYVVRID